MSSEDLITIAIDQMLYMRVRAYALKQEIESQERKTLQTVIETWLQTFLQRHPEPKLLQPIETSTTTRTKMPRLIIAQVRAYALKCENHFNQSVTLQTVIDHIIREALIEAEQATPPDDGTPA